MGEWFEFDAVHSSLQRVFEVTEKEELKDNIKSAFTRQFDTTLAEYLLYAPQCGSLPHIFNKFLRILARYFMFFCVFLQRDNRLRYFESFLISTFKHVMDRCF